MRHEVWIVLVILLVVIYWKRVHPTIKNSGVLGNSVGLVSQLKNMRLGIWWWLKPLGLWAVINFLVWYYFPSAWNFIWEKQLLFWVLQGGNLYLIRDGHGRYDTQGRPERALYPSVLGIALFVVLVLGYCFGSHKSTQGSPKAQQGNSQSAVSTSSESSVPTPSPKATEPAMGWQSTAKEVPVDDGVAIIPAGYHVSRVDGIEDVTFTITNIKGGKSKWEFASKTNKPAPIHVWCEPDWR